MGEKGGASSAKRRFGILSPFQTTITIRLSISICQKVIHTGSIQTVAGQIACAVSNIILWSSVIGYAGYHTYKKTFGRKKPDNNTKPEENTTNSTSPKDQYHCLF